MSKKVQLVLGSGGARGIAHIAVIEELEQLGFEIIEIVGCSMGAVIGGIYATGHLKEYKQWLFSLDRNQVFDLTDFTLKREGFVKGEKIFSKHREMTGNLKIEDFHIPFTAVSVDVKSGRKFILPLEIYTKHFELRYLFLEYFYPLKTKIKCWLMAVF